MGWDTYRTDALFLSSGMEERRECVNASGIIYCFRGVMKSICIIYVNIHSFAFS